MCSQFLARGELGRLMIISAMKQPVAPTPTVVVTQPAQLNGCDRGAPLQKACDVAALLLVVTPDEHLVQFVCTLLRLASSLNSPCGQAATRPGACKKYPCGTTASTAQDADRHTHARIHSANQAESGSRLYIKVVCVLCACARLKPNSQLVSSGPGT